MHNSKWWLVHNDYNTAALSEIWRKIRLHTGMIVVVRSPNEEKKLFRYLV